MKVYVVHHTDGVREYAYDSVAVSGKLVQALKEASQRGWKRTSRRYPILTRKSAPSQRAASVQ